MLGSTKSGKIQSHNNPVLYTKNIPKKIVFTILATCARRHTIKMSKSKDSHLQKFYKILDKVLNTTLEYNNINFNQTKRTKLSYLQGLKHVWRELKDI